MELQKQVCSLEISKRLKELAEATKSYPDTYYNWIKDFDNSMKGWHLTTLRIPDSREGCPAFTVAELGEIIKTIPEETLKKLPDEYWCEDSKEAFEQLFDVNHWGKCIIYLLENGLINNK